MHSAEISKAVQRLHGTKFRKKVVLDLVLAQARAALAMLDKQEPEEARHTIAVLIQEILATLSGEEHALDWRLADDVCGNARTTGEIKESLKKRLAALELVKNTML